MDGILLVNKDSGISSAEVVRQIKRLLNSKKVGHCGTLDPLAEGLLIILLGKATKYSDLLLKQTKVYRAGLLLGKSTDSYDITGEQINAKTPLDHSPEQIEQVLKQFLGTSMQIPPKYSALKVKGKRLYEYARNNEEVEIRPRSITISDISLLKFFNNTIDFTVTCSSGTYVRTLCVDIAGKLGEFGTMSALKRLKIGDFSLNQANSISDIEKNMFRLYSPEEIFINYPQVEYEDVKALINGRRINIVGKPPEVLVTHQGKIMALYHQDGEEYACKRGLF